MLRPKTGYHEGYGYALTVVSEMVGIPYCGAHMSCLPYRLALSWVPGQLATWLMNREERFVDIMERADLAGSQAHRERAFNSCGCEAPKIV